MMNELLEKKYEALKEYLRSLGRVAVAYSSGVDSTLLLKVAHDVLQENAIALTARSSFFPGRELAEAKEFCNKEGIRQIVCAFDELEIENFVKNPPNRCYYCKHALFEAFLSTANKQGIDCVVEGSNMDDESDYRPGHQAIQELGIKSPLRKAGLYKEEIRQLSKMFGLPTWDKPSFACLASRFVYGEMITKEKLAMVDRAEQQMLNLGFHQFRVRIHGEMARIEVLPEEFDKLMEPRIRSEIVQKFTEYGFTYVTMDLKGYRTGSMNETLS